MILRSNGLRFPNWLEKNLLKSSSWLRRRLPFTVRLDEHGYRSVYRCETVLDAARPMSLWVKEAATMRWLDSELGAGDVFLDIGANIGIYTIAAAHRVGDRGKVYAFEPHGMNVLSLMQNVTLSGLASRVEVFSSPLSDEPGAARFNYSSLGSASSGSQLGHARMAGKDRDFSPVASEIKLATTVDTLITDGTLLPPSLVKIDVDGNELKILHGMRKLLTGRKRPRSLQVELNVGEQAAVVTFLGGCGYTLVARHHTAGNERKAAAGVPLEQIAHNAIFRPRRAATRPKKRKPG